MRYRLDFGGEYGGLGPLGLQGSEMWRGMFL